MTDNEIVNMIDRYIELKTEVREIQEKLDKVSIKQRLRVAWLITLIGMGRNNESKTNRYT